MTKDSHVTAQKLHSFPVREGDKFRISSSWKILLFNSVFSEFFSRGSLFMLLHLKSITFVVCTAEISEFHVFFLCLSPPLENFSLVSFDACDNFSLPFVVVSLPMPQSRGSCGHLKGSYDNHMSCLNRSGCFRSSCCSVCHSWPDSTCSLVARRWRFWDRQMGKTKEKEEKAKVKKRKYSASRNSSSSRRGLEQTVARADPPGSTADGHDDDAASVLSLSSSGGERVRGDTQVPGSQSSHGTPGLSPKERRAHRSTPARSQAGDLAGKYGVQTPAKDFEATLLGPNPTPGDSDQVQVNPDRKRWSGSTELMCVIGEARIKYPIFSGPTNFYVYGSILYCLHYGIMRQCY